MPKPQDRAQILITLAHAMPASLARGVMLPAVRSKKLIWHDLTPDVFALRVADVCALA